jgi:indolepyruvate ferredoxin oxidoreductase, beta subunit
MNNKKQDVLMAGVGGQGIILASDILSEVAINAGYDVKKTDTIGMAQRGGSVTSHIRLSDKVWAPMIKEGEADILLAFENLEAVRWASYLRDDGLVIINNYMIPPLSVSMGTTKYPSNPEIITTLKQKTGKIYFVDGNNKAKAIGDTRTVNILMLGCMSFFLPIEITIWRNTLIKKLPKKILEINLKAFEQGRREIENVNLK